VASAPHRSARSIIGADRRAGRPRFSASRWVDGSCRSGRRLRLAAGTTTPPAHAGIARFLSYGASRDLSSPRRRAEAPDLPQRAGEHSHGSRAVLRSPARSCGPEGTQLVERAPARASARYRAARSSTISSSSYASTGARHPRDIPAQALTCPTEASSASDRVASTDQRSISTSPVSAT